VLVAEEAVVVDTTLALVKIDQEQAVLVVK
jgi:hypothetical protein